MSIKHITLASLVFSISFFNNAMAMDQESRFIPNYFTVYTNADLEKAFPSKNGLYGYPQPAIAKYKPGSIDPNLYSKVMSQVLTINLQIMQPDAQKDLPQDLHKAAPQDVIQKHISEVEAVTEENIKMLTHLNQLFQ